MAREVAAEYRTRTGQIGAVVYRHVAPWGITYSYMGKWGAGSGLCLADMRADVTDWLATKRGITVIVPFTETESQHTSERFRGGHPHVQSI
jgi:hypothetical protein